VEPVACCGRLTGGRPAAMISATIPPSWCRRPCTRRRWAPGWSRASRRREESAPAGSSRGR